VLDSKKPTNTYLIFGIYNINMVLKLYNLDQICFQAKQSIPLSTAYLLSHFNVDWDCFLLLALGVQSHCSSDV